MTRIYYIVGLLIAVNAVFGQDLALKIRYLRLNDVVDIALAQSPSVRYYRNQKENSYWRFRNFRTSLRPQLEMDGELPNYISTYSPITQPDGTIEFHSVKKNYTTLGITISQVIASTGTELFAGSDLQRIDNFSSGSSTSSYSGTPFKIGFSQPIFAFNSLKWDKKIEPLLWEEAQKEFDETIENIAKNATNYFFAFLRVQTQFELAKSNVKNSQQNIAIAEVKDRLGKISKNDLARVRLAVLNAKKALSSAKQSMSTAEFSLKSYLGFNQTQSIVLILPKTIPQMTIPIAVAMKQAKLNRKEVPSFQRRLLQAQQSRKSARRNNGFSATLTGSYGVTNSSQSLGDLTENPQRMEMLRLGFSVPVLDWGRSSSRVKMAESEWELTQYQINKDLEDFEREVVVVVEQFPLLYEYITISQMADKVSEDGYNIALKQYQNGNLSISDLTIALQEREQSRLDYISSLSSFWSAYFNIRSLTLFDFVLGQPLVKGKKDSEVN